MDLVRGEAAVGLIAQVPEHPLAQPAGPGGRGLLPAGGGLERPAGLSGLLVDLVHARQRGAQVPAAGQHDRGGIGGGPDLLDVPADLGHDGRIRRRISVFATAGGRALAGARPGVVARLVVPGGCGGADRHRDGGGVLLAGITFVVSSGAVAGLGWLLRCGVSGVADAGRSPGRRWPPAARCRLGKAAARARPVAPDRDAGHPAGLAPPPGQVKMDVPGHAGTTASPERGARGWSSWRGRIRTALSSYRAATTTQREGLPPPSTLSASRRTHDLRHTTPGRFLSEMGSARSGHAPRAAAR